MTKEETTDKIISLCKENSINNAKLSDILGLGVGTVSNKKTLKIFTENHLEKVKEFIENNPSDSAKLDYIYNEIKNKKNKF